MNQFQQCDLQPLLWYVGVEISILVTGMNKIANKSKFSDRLWQIKDGKPNWHFNESSLTKKWNKPKNIHRNYPKKPFKIFPECSSI